MLTNFLPLIGDALIETIVMVAVSGFVGALAEVPLRDRALRHRQKELPADAGAEQLTLGTVINAMRSVPLHHSPGGDHPLRAWS